ncbi:MAG: SxtJ family membrane protein [Pseudomonadota bacterium]
MNTTPELPTNRRFGAFFTTVFAVLAAYLWLTDTRATAVAAIGASSVLLMCTLAKPDLLWPLNRVWMRFGLLLGAIVSPIVLGIVFFVLFTPVALVMRVAGRDELRQRPRRLASYWKPREVDADRPDAFKNQF